MVKSEAGINYFIV